MSQYCRKEANKRPAKIEEHRRLESVIWVEGKKTKKLIKLQERWIVTEKEEK